MCLDETDFDELYYFIDDSNDDLEYEKLVYSCIRFLIDKNSLYWDEVEDDLIWDVIGGL